MKAEIKQNFEEKLRLLNSQLLNSLDASIKIMMAEHARDGMVMSGNTIKRTIDFITAENSNFYHEITKHLETLKPDYYHSLESDIIQLTASAQKAFKSEALQRLSKTINLIGKQDLYSRMVSDVEGTMANQLAIFQNNLNAAVLNIKPNNKSPLKIVLWCFEAVFIIALVFVFAMQSKNPNGNYGAAFITLGIIIPLIPAIIAIIPTHAKK